MSDVSKSPSRPDLEKARLDMKVQKGAPPVGGVAVDTAPEGTIWDKESPQGPPNPKVRKIPDHLKKVTSFFAGLIADEGLLLDMCFEHCMEIVKQNIESRMVGTDFFQGDGQAANPFTPAHYASVAGPMACELYRNVLKAVEGREEEFRDLVAEAAREREKENPGPSSIIIPG